MRRLAVAVILALVVSQAALLSASGSGAPAPPGWTRASSHADLEDLYRDNLLPDFEPFKDASYTVSDLSSLLEKLLDGRPPKHLTLLLVKDGKVTALPMTEAPPALTAKRVEHIVSGLNNASRQGVALQDTLMVLNTWDEPRCAKSLKCTVPIFSLIKQWNWKTKAGVQKDVLVPFFSHFYGDLINTPWESKTGKALMRAAAQNGMHRNCTRLWLLELAKNTDVGKRLLDVGITNNLKKGLNVEIADYVDIPQHANWKYLLSTDGFTASCRFGKLLQTNSVVLKEESQWIEYYYRSLVDGVHSHSFNKDNVLTVLERLEASPATELQAVASVAQQFGYTRLSTHAKALYVARAIELHNGLFTDVAPFVASLGEEQTGSFGALLAAVRAWRDG